jgi:hypothetical protein
MRIAAPKIFQPPHTGGEMFCVARGQSVDSTLSRESLESPREEACAVEAAAELREPSPGNSVKFDEIMDALRSLDKEATVRPDYGKLLSRVQRVKELCWKNNGVLGTERRTQ